jgi:hypothetical protein
MNNLNNNNKFNSTEGFNEMKIGRIFEIESFANDFNKNLEYKKLQNLVKILLIIFFFRKKIKQN